MARLEENFDRNRTLAERIADAVGGFTGSFRFVILHAIGFGAWIVVNLRWIPGLRPFDPFPFMLLSLVVSIEAIFLATFVLMKQNRMSQRADQRAHLDLQVNLLAEQEMTIVLQMLQRISTRLGVRHPAEAVEQLSEETSVEALATELQQRLGKEQG